MTHSDIYTKFMIEYDKAMITSSYPSLTKYEVATLLDKAYLALIAQKVTGNNPRQVLFEQDVKAIEDIRPLLVTKKQIAKSYTPDNEVTNGFVCKLPKDLLYFVSATTKVHKVPAVPTRDYKQSRIENVVLVDHTTASKFFATDTNMPWIKTPVAYIEGDYITTIYDLYEAMKHNSFPSELNITYIKKPAKFALSLEDITVPVVDPTTPTQGGNNPDPTAPSDDPVDPTTPVTPTDDPGNNDDPNGGNSGGGTTITSKTVLFDFAHPDTLNPAIDMSNIVNSESLSLLEYHTNKSFKSSDGDITLQFDSQDSVSASPAIINDNDSYALRMDPDERIVIQAKNNAKIKSIQFKKSIYGDPRLFKVDNKYYQRYTEGYKDDIQNHVNPNYIEDQDKPQKDGQGNFIFTFENGVTYVSIVHSEIKFADYSDIRVNYDTYSSNSGNGGNSGGNSGGTTVTKTATFNFDNPTSLNPSITPSTDTGDGLVPVKGDGQNISFTTSDGKITVSFELDANNGNYPVYIKTIGSQYFLQLNTGTKMVITASQNTSIDSVKFGGSDDGGYVLITDVNDQRVSQFMELNDTQTYYEWYSPSNTTVTSVKIRQNSQPLALFGKLYVNYRTVDNSGGGNSGGNVFTDVDFPTDGIREYNLQNIYNVYLYPQDVDVRSNPSLLNGMYFIMKNQDTYQDLKLIVNSGNSTAALFYFQNDAITDSPRNTGKLVQDGDYNVKVVWDTPFGTDPIEVPSQDSICIILKKGALKDESGEHANGIQRYYY